MRGSGTSGHIQTNKFNLRKPPEQQRDQSASKTSAREPNKDILEHSRKRQIEVQVEILREDLEDEGLDEDEIEKRLTEYRQRLQIKSEASRTADDLAKSKAAERETHEIAARKQQQMGKLADAFGLRNVKEGEAFDQELQQRKKQGRMAERERWRAEEELRKQSDERRGKLEGTSPRKEGTRTKELEKRKKRSRRSPSSTSSSSDSSGSDDESPPRKRTTARPGCPPFSIPSDSSPNRRQRENSSSSASPPRRRKRPSSFSYSE